MDGASGATSSSSSSNAAASASAASSNSTSANGASDASSPSASSSSSSSAAGGDAAGSQLASQPSGADALSNTPSTLGTLSQQPTQAEVLAQGPSPGAPTATAATTNAANDDNAVPGPSITGAAQGVKDAGFKTLVDNPQLSVQWESTRSAWTGKVGFTPGMTDVLNQNGLTINPSNMTPAPGSFGKTSGLSANEANPRNGAAADAAIGNRLAGQGYGVDYQQEVANGRRVDVVGTKANADPRLNERVEIESKAYRAGASEFNVSEAVRDGQRLADNRALRAAGNVLENVGRVARPVGLVLDAVEVGSAYKADGNKIGENTGRAVSGLAGSAAVGWGGAMTGAAIGTAILPGVGTVVGGLIGGIGGAFVGDGIGRSAFNAIRSWF